MYGVKELVKYKVECPRCNSQNFFNVDKGRDVVVVVCRKCHYMFKVGLSAERIPIDIDAIAVEADTLAENVLGGVLFIFLLGGSIFSPPYFLMALTLIIVSLFFPPLIIFPVAISFYAVFSSLGLSAALIYAAISLLLVALYLYVKVFTLAKTAS